MCLAEKQQRAATTTAKKRKQKLLFGTEWNYIRHLEDKFPYNSGTYKIHHPCELSTYDTDPALAKGGSGIGPGVE